MLITKNENATGIPMNMSTKRQLMMIRNDSHHNIAMAPLH